MTRVNATLWGIFVQVLEKLNEMYDMKVIESYEYRPEGFEMQSDFFLPEGPYSELMKEKVRNWKYLEKNRNFIWI